MKINHKKKIIWYRHLYMGELARKKRYTIVHNIKAGKLLYDVYVIVLPQTKHNQLELVNANQLLAPWYRKSPLRIVGIAIGYEEAVSLLEKMFLDAYEHIGEYNPRLFIERDMLSNLCNANI